MPARRGKHGVGVGFPCGRCCRRGRELVRQIVTVDGWFAQTHPRWIIPSKDPAGLALPTTGEGEASIDGDRLRERP